MMGIIRDTYAAIADANARAEAELNPAEQAWQDAWAARNPQHATMAGCKCTDCKGRDAR